MKLIFASSLVRIEYLFYWHSGDFYAIRIDVRHKTVVSRYSVEYLTFRSNTLPSFISTYRFPHCMITIRFHNNHSCQGKQQRITYCEPSLHLKKLYPFEITELSKTWSLTVFITFTYHNLPSVFYKPKRVKSFFYLRSKAIKSLITKLNLWSNFGSSTPYCLSFILIKFILESTLSDVILKS